MTASETQPEQGPKPRWTSVGGWKRPLKGVGYFLLAFPAWILGIPGHAPEGSPAAQGWGFGLAVILLYPLSILLLMVLSRLHMWLGAKAGGTPAELERSYVKCANLFLTLAILGMAGSCARMVS